MQLEQIRNELVHLGVGQENYRVLAILPLVQIAWADGVVQPAERALIMSALEKLNVSSPSATMIVDSWLKHEPSLRYLTRGRKLLTELVRRTSGVGDSLTSETLDDVVELCESVANAAGGVFGWGAICMEEREALSEIANALALGHTDGDDFSMLLAEFDDEADDDEVTEIGPMLSSLVTMDCDGEVLFEQSSTLALARLVLFEGTTDERVVDCVAEKTTIGRSREADIQCSSDNRMSRVHCRLEFTEGRCHITDLESLNGTWVNDERVATRRLYGSEELLVGETRFRFLLSN